MNLQAFESPRCGKRPGAATLGSVKRRMAAAMLLLVSAWPGRAQEVPEPVAAARDVAALLPESCVLHVTVDPAPLVEHAGDLALARILKEPEVARFLAPVSDMLHEMLRQAQASVEEMTGLDAAAAERLLEGRLTVSLLGFSLPTPGRDVDLPDALVTWDLGSAAPAVRDALPRLESLLRDLVDEDIERLSLAGTEVSFLRESGDQGLLYAVRDGMLLAGTHRASFEDVLRRLATGDATGTLARSKVYEEVSRHVVGDHTVVAAWCDLRRLLDALYKEMPEETRDAFALWGLDAYAGMGYGLDLDGAAIRDRFYASLSDRQGWTAARIEDGRVEAHRLLPASTGMYIAGLMDLEKSYDALIQTLEQGYPRVAQQVREAINQIDIELGFNLRDDLLGVLGPEYGFYMATPGQAVIPDVGMFLQVKEDARQKVDGIIATVTEAVADRIDIRRITYRGHTIHYLDMSRLGDGSASRRTLLSNVKPAFAVVRGYLVVTLWPQAIKNLVLGLETGTPRLADRPDFALLAEKTGAGEKGVASISYVDLAGMAGFLLDNGVPFLQSLVPSPREFPMELGAFPTTDAVTRHLFGLIATSRWTSDHGIYSEIYSPTGGLPLYAVAVGAVAGLFLAGGVEVSASSQVWPVPELGARQRVEHDLSQLQALVFAFRDWEMRLPEEKEWPAFVIGGSPHHPDPYGPPTLLTDPWGHPYLFERKGAESFTISTLGSDGKPGGEGEAADVRSTDLK